MQFLQAAKNLLLPFAAARERLASRAAPDDAQPSPDNSRETLLELHGPLSAPMPRRAGMHRAQLLISAANRRALHGALDAVVPALHALPEARKVRWSLDVDPVDLY